MPYSGWWTLNTATRNGRLKQQPYRLDQMGFVLAHIDRSIDRYMSQGFFAVPNRRALNLKWATHAYVDLDIYNIPGMSGWSKEQIVFRLLAHCAEVNIPAPSYIIHSGRGLYLKWAWNSPIPREAAGRAVAVNRVLVGLFADFGADPKAIDMSRILRVVGTVNSKSGTVAELLWQNEADGQVVTYHFSTFADRMLPYALEDVAGFKVAAKNRGVVQVFDHERRRRDAASRKAGKAACWEDWHWKVLEDIRTISDRRYPDGIPEGKRDTIAFLGSCQLAMVMPAAQLWYEIRTWTGLILPHGWINDEFHAMASTLLARATMAARGEKVEWRGRQVSPIYTFSKQRMIEELGITSAEMEGLRALIDTGEKRRRETVKRREAGVQERAQYEAQAHQAAEDILRIFDRLGSIQAVAEALGISYETAKKKLQRARKR